MDAGQPDRVGRQRSIRTIPSRMALLKRAFSNFRGHRVRLALPVLAVALSVSLVVAVTSGYASADAAARLFLDRFFGAIDAEVTRRNDNYGAMSEDVVAQLRADPDVEHITPRLGTYVALSRPEPGALISRPADVIGIRR